MESREKVNESTVQFENGKENPEPTKTEKIEKPVVKKPRSWFSRAYRIFRILRVVEILILVVLLILTTYLMMESTKKLLTSVAGILLIALFSTYLLILSVDIISRKTRRTLPDTPMFLFGVLGFLLFAAAAQGVHMFLYSQKNDALLLAVIVLCAIEALLFLLDVVIIVLNWRQSYTRVDKCPLGTPVSNVTTIYRPGTNYSQRTVRTSDPFVFQQGDVRDVTTSVSDYQRPSHPDLANLHKYRKIGVGHRRQYIDRPVNAQSAICLKVVEVQTDPPEKKAVSDVESLIVADVKEEPAQTVPRCPVCANNWDPQGTPRRPDSFGLCPTFLHLAQSFGMCNCSHPSSSVLRPTPVGVRTESTSATDLGVSRRVEKPNSRKNSGEERR